MTESAPCPMCKAEVVWDDEARFLPFCSERCKMVDLGRWIDEEYRIPITQSSTERQLPDDDESLH